MRRCDVDRQILAITYTDGELAAGILRRLVARLGAAGAACAGFLQRDLPPPPGHSRCGMVLECVSTGERLQIYEDRGPLARGCRLDVGMLIAALVSAREAIRSRPDVLVVNKFGKTEAEGGGFRPLIADAIDLGVPVLIAVPWRNIESWRRFAGDFAAEIVADTLRPEADEGALAAIGLLVAAGQRSPGTSLSDSDCRPATALRADGASACD